ncbi:DUF6232 family protein [uncultured Caballeronia sp.]|jgi:hypothetical protein|uniref:DUF6232 family protein n=1 Tax=uncultured Caballeronia sp. TaxID=1827198 RepID=UPI0035CA6BDE
MALTNCGECSREISDKAASCPNCGAPVKTPPRSLPVQEAEQVFLNEQGVVITSSRFVLPGSQTFAMSGVTAVRAHEEKPNRIGALLLILFGGAALLNKANIWWVVVPIVLGVLLFIAQKPMYFVVLSTASGETQALKDRSRTWINKIVSALTDCIVFRG